MFPIISLKIGRSGFVLWFSSLTKAFLTSRWVDGHPSWKNFIHGKLHAQLYVHVISQKIICTYISGLQHVNFIPKTLCYLFTWHTGLGDCFSTLWTSTIQYDPQWQMTNQNWWPTQKYGQPQPKGCLKITLILFPAEK